MLLLTVSQRLPSRVENPCRTASQKTSLSSNPPAREIRVVVANDHPVAREGLSSTLRSLEGIMNLHCSQTLRRGGGAKRLVPPSFGWLRSNPFGAGKKAGVPLIAARSTEG